MSAFGKLNLADVSKGGVVVVLGALADAVAQIIHGCATLACIAGFDWLSVISTALLAGVAYIAKNILTTEDGKVLGRIG